MSILQTGNTMERITDALSILTTNVKLQNSRGRTDINADAEDFYCGLLNIVLDKNLSNLNGLQMDFPAIDLADREARLCVQVTSTEGRGKVNHTLEKFYERDMQKDFDRLIVLVIGEKGNFQKPFPGKGRFTFDHREDIWDTAKLLARIEGLDEAKRDRVAEYLQKHLDIPRTQSAPIHLPVNPTPGFVGRRAELEQMARMIEGGVKPLVIWGLGGMGKTELVSRFGAEYRRGNVYMALYRGSFRDTVADSIAFGIPELRDQELRPEQRYELTMERLARCDENDILILDNADGPGSSFEELKREPAFRALCGLGLRIIVTTRMQVREGIELKPMDNAELYQLFDRYGLGLPVETMDALIAAVNSHTMTVDLMARTMDESWETVTAEMILEAMKSSSLPEADYPEVYTDHDQDPQQRQIYAHLRSLFNLTNIPEEGKQALRCATLLPTGGMDPAIFLKALPEGPAKAIRLLEKQGWVQRADHLLTIHPVVRLVCKTELKPTQENCHAFVMGVWGWYDDKKYDHVRYSQMAELFTAAGEVLDDPSGWYMNRAGFLWDQLGDARQALECNLRAVELLEQNQPDSKNLAAAYSNVGLTYGDLGDYERALEYQLKALAIREKVLPPNHPDLATSYNNVGSAYGDLGDHKRALEYQLKALAIKEKVLPPDHPDLALSYNNVGSTYGDLGDHKRALEYQLKALAICEKVLPPTHPSLALSCNNVAWTYYRMAEYDTALEYMRRAADIAAQSLPEGHPDRVDYCRWAERFEREVRQRRGEE